MRDFFELLNESPGTAFLCVLGAYFLLRATFGGRNG